MSEYEIAQRGYAIWRGNYRGGKTPPPHWEDMDEDEQSAFVAVASYARALPPPPDAA